jgi:hypothetical protein
MHTIGNVIAQMKDPTNCCVICCNRLTTVSGLQAHCDGLGNQRTQIGHNRPNCLKHPSEPSKDGSHGFQAGIQ